MPKIIVIDPGHGGKDPGATGGNLLEKDICLDIARKLRLELQPYDVDIRLTRDRDLFVALNTRADFANSLRADYFLSLHNNAGGGTGFESFISSTPSAAAIQAQETIHSMLAAFFGKHGFIDRGKKRANFAVLRRTQMPAILLENLFIDHPVDRTFLADETKRRLLAVIIKDALVRAVGLQLKEVAWDPAGEIARLNTAGIITSLHQPQDVVNWAELATVLNRLRGRVVQGRQNWSPELEIKALYEDNLITTLHRPFNSLLWGPFATVLNRLRGKRFPDEPVWNPEREIKQLQLDKLINTLRQPTDLLYWGEFATVINRHRS